MNTLILYATKYGAAREIAERISERIGGATLHDLAQTDIPALAEFDCVIIGSSVYAGSIRKEAKAFVAKNAGDLRNKKLGLFLSGMDKSGKKKVFDSNFPPDIVQSAKAASFLGGIFDPKKAGTAERLIMKAVTKQSAYMNNIDDGKIKQFAEAMRE